MNKQRNLTKLYGWGELSLVSFGIEVFEVDLAVDEYTLEEEFS